MDKIILSNESRRERIAIPIKPPAPEKILTARELEICRHLHQGSSIKETAFDLDLAVKTVRGHLERIYIKIQVHSITQLIIFLCRAWGS